MLKTLGNPRSAFAKLISFAGLSLLLFVTERSGWFNESKLQNSNANSDGMSLRSQLMAYVWPNRRSLSSDKYSTREMMWEALVNKTRSQLRNRRFPDVFVVGAERCGSDAVARLLLLHPLVKGTNPLDAQFFTRHYNKGQEYYKNMTPWVTEIELALEASQNYYTWPPMAIPMRIKKLTPNAKIIVVLCNPADRVAADYNAEIQSGKMYANPKYQLFLGNYIRKFEAKMKEVAGLYDAQVQSSIAESFQRDYPTHLLSSGMYYYHALRWKAAFKSSQIKYLSRQDVLQHPGEIVEELQQFLQIPLLLIKEDFVYDLKAKTFCFTPRWESQHKPPGKRCPLAKEASIIANQSQSCAQSLKTFYQPYNEKLYELLGRNFGW